MNRIYFLWLYDWGACLCLGCWLEAVQKLSPFLDMWPLPQAVHNVVVRLLGTIEQFLSLSGWLRCHHITKYESWIWHPITLLIFYCMRHVTGCTPFQGGEDIQGYYSLRVTWQGIWHQDIEPDNLLNFFPAISFYDCWRNTENSLVLIF